LEDEELQTIEPFHPSFTYPIFGDQEKIYGYEGLSINLKFASGSLRQHLDITFDQKIDSVDTPAEDIEGKLYQFIPSDYTKSTSTFEEWVEKDGAGFKPLGEKMSSYVRPSAAAVAQANGGKKGKSKGKGKGKANGANGSAAALAVDEDSEDAVVYEVYKVSGRILSANESC
jgi:histone acetyltransferase 1